MLKNVILECSSLTKVDTPMRLGNVPSLIHDDVIKWKHFPRYWSFVRGIHWSPVNSPHKGQWRGDLMFALICTWINSWVNNREVGDLRRHCAHYDVTVMFELLPGAWSTPSYFINQYEIFHLRVPELQMSCGYMTRVLGYHDISPSNGH